MDSPLQLKEALLRGLSAGRVQSVATRLVVQREREIRAFMPEEYWDVAVDLLAGEHEFSAEVFKHNGDPFKPTNGAASRSV